MKFLYFVLGAGCQYLEYFGKLNKTNYSTLYAEYMRMSGVIIDEFELNQGSMNNEEWKKKLLNLGIGKDIDDFMSLDDEVVKTIIRNNIISNLSDLVKQIVRTPNENQNKFFKNFNNLVQIVMFYYYLSKKSKIPIENIFIKCYNYATSNIVKTYLGISPLRRFTRVGWQESNVVVSLCSEILEKAQVKGNDIIVMGHSYGGAIINKTAKLMSQLLITAEFKDHHTEKIFFLGFGSIYIPTEPPPGVNLINYLSLGDVAMKTNRLASKIPPFQALNKVFLDPDYIEPYNYICTFRGDNNNENCYIRWICLFEENVPLCFNERERKISMFDWKEHFYYELIFQILEYNSIIAKSGNPFVFVPDIKNFHLWVDDYTPNLESVENIGGKMRRKRRSSKIINTRKNTRKIKY